MYITNFDEDIIDIILNVFKSYNVKFFDPDDQDIKVDSWMKKFTKVHAAESRKRLLFYQFANFTERLIKHRKWKVRLSSKIELINDQSLKRKINFFIGEATSGRDLVGFQSKDILRPYKEDLMLARMGIDHVHLSTEREDHSIFFKRSDFLLMLHISHGTIYLLDVVPHSDNFLLINSREKSNLAFYRQDVFRTLIREFPENNPGMRLGGILPPKSSDVLRDDEYKAVVNSGVNSMFSVDNFVYAGGNGTSTAKTSIRNKMTTDSFMKMFYIWEEYIKTNYEDIFLESDFTLDVVRPRRFKVFVGADGFQVGLEGLAGYVHPLIESVYFKR